MSRSDLDKLLILQENCLDYLKIAFEIMSRKPKKTNGFLNSFYKDHFINISYSQIKGATNDRQGVIRTTLKRKSTS